jgi:hypothetical protein
MLPQALVKVLRRNIERKELAERRAIIENFLTNLNQFSISPTVYVSDTIYLLLKYQREISSVFDSCRSLISDCYPNPAEAAQLCERFVVAYSYFCAEIGRCAKYLETRLADFTELLLRCIDFIPYLISAEMRLIVYQNLYKGCLSCFNYLMTVDVLTSNSALVVSMRASIKKVLMAIPVEDAELYQRTNSLFLLFVKHHLISILAMNNDYESITFAKAARTDDITFRIFHSSTSFNDCQISLL